VLRLGQFAFPVLLFGASTVLAAGPMAPSEIQATFFIGQPFTATTPSSTKFKMTFTPDEKMTREPLAQHGDKSASAWKLNPKGFCTTWSHSKSNCFTIVPSREIKWSAKTRQFGAICTTPGNLCLYGTACWGWELSHIKQAQRLIKSAGKNGCIELKRELFAYPNLRSGKIRGFVLACSGGK
jgi:hypothetical protein